MGYLKVILAPVLLPCPMSNLKQLLMVARGAWVTVLALDCDAILNKSQMPPDFREIVYLVFFLHLHRYK